VPFGTKKKTQREFRLGMETMEDRVVLTTFNVANVPQLQAAIAAVSHSTTPNTIILASKNYSLPGALNIQNASNLTMKVVGGKTGNLVGDGVDRVLSIQNSNVTINGIGISGGGSVAQGGAIYANTSNVTLHSDTVSGNTATQAGGGIYTLGGTLRVDHSTISGNMASNSSAAFGGGIASVNTAVTLVTSTIEDNQATAYDQQSQQVVLAGGGGIYAQGGTLTSSGSQLVNNIAQSVTNGTQAVALGGAIQASSTNISVVNSTFDSNSINAFSSKSFVESGGAVSSTGGTLSVVKSKFTANTPASSAVSVDPGSVVVMQGSTVEGRKLSGRFTMNGRTLIRVR
jgi:predicted outer membrane repeat protein